MSLATAVATIEHRMATAVTIPNVMAAPLWSSADVTIMPAIPTTQTDSVAVRTTRMLRMTGPISPAPGACT